MVIEESRIKFDFPEDTDVIKFDDSVYYRKQFNVLPGAKGVDFISLNKEYAAFIEVKNCVGDEGNCRWRICPNNAKKNTTHTTVNVKGRDSLDVEVAEKMAMTLAALAGMLSFGERRLSNEKLEYMAEAFVSEYLKNDKKKKYVILFLEGDFASHTRSKKTIMMELQRSLNAKMRWFDCKVSVVDSTTYSHKLFQVV
jgi:hypothetical protein